MLHAVVEGWFPVDPLDRTRTASGPKSPKDADRSPNRLEKRRSHADAISPVVSEWQRLLDMLEPRNHIPAASGHGVTWLDISTYLHTTYRSPLAPLGSARFGVRHIIRNF